MLKVENLWFSYGKKTVLKDINFELKKGELCGLFGPNGTGKSTLFRCCLRFLVPDSGCIRIMGQKIDTLKIKELARHVAYVPQAHHSTFSFTAGDMVLMGRTPHLNRYSTPSALDRKVAWEAMETLDIAHLAHESFDRLSGGQQQMVLIARAIAQEPEMILLDEPAAALDFSNQVNLWELLKKIADQGTTILACSHDPNHVAWFCHTTVVLDSSGILAKGDPSQVLCQEIMNRIYKDTCRVKEIDGLKMMIPRGVMPKKNKVVTFPGNLKERRCK